MATITLRETKGSPLTFAEADANFTNLNDDKQETIPNLGVVTSADMSADKISFYDATSAATRSIPLRPANGTGVTIPAYGENNGTYCGLIRGVKRGGAIGAIGTGVVLSL